MVELQITLILFLILLITAIILRFFIADLIYEKQNTDVFTIKSQWDSNIIAVSNDCKKNFPWPDIEARCMIEGEGQYLMEYKRNCLKGNCINFDGDLINGFDQFTGLCENNYCGMIRCLIKFENDSYVTVSDAGLLGNGGETQAAEFIMRRLDFNDKGEMISSINGVFARFFYYDLKTQKQYYISYNNNTSVNNSQQFTTSLNLTQSEGIGFPSTNLTLFLLMEEITNIMVNLPLKINSPMKRKILVFSSPKLTIDSDLINGDNLLYLQNMSAKSPSQTFDKGIVPISCGIMRYDTSRNGYFLATDYVADVKRITGDDQREISQDIIEKRLINNNNVIYFQWK